MKETEENRNAEMTQGKQNDCGCDGDCCPPKKSNPFTKIIFIVVVVAALGIVGVKLFSPSPPAAAIQACCPEGTAGCDTSKAAACDTSGKAKCDTSKGTSCCPK
jgi:hypothetical protein